MNFVETMALYRAFTVGRFKCLSATPAVMAADFPSLGYALVIRKESIKKFCLDCAKNYFVKKGLKVAENEKFLTIQSP
ncbi:hypothetical protein E2P63_05265 [Candidatus Bathyarchaeota archaeon]|nr:hypothetical protein E2P63_05265 [Candidatus Bathyarchaeota archaeon]